MTDGYKIKRVLVWKEDNDMQGPAPKGFHVPSDTDWQAIYDAGISLGAWSSSNGTNLSTYLKLPPAGFRNYFDLNFIGRGSEDSPEGHYWSSTPVINAYNEDAGGLYFDEYDIRIPTAESRSNGCSVRCVKVSPVVPTSSWTVLYQGSGSAGIYHNPTDGLISISSNGSTWYTIMDKNLGATTVYNYGDTLTEANCGKVYQRGNNYGFSGDANYDVSLISQSSTQVDVTGYGPGNYYSSSTWITTYPRQSSASDGNNLRGGVSQQTGFEEYQVYPAAEPYIPFTPGTNTLAYFPFDSDAVDKTGHYTITNTGTQQTIGRQFTTTSQLNSIPTNCNTMMGWVYAYVLSGTTSGQSLILRGVRYNYNFMLGSQAQSNLPKFYMYKNADYAAGGGILTTGVWTHIALTWTGSALKGYINGTEYTVYSGSNPGNPDMCFLTYVSGNQTLNVVLSDVILESVAWTQSEIETYYNNTKSKYGL